jgi:phosphonate transport system permease protein
VVAFVVAPLATRALLTGSYLVAPPPRRGAGRLVPWLISGLARIAFQVCRAMPELTLALLFVMWVGPGPFAGVLAISVHTVGVLGRLYTDVYDEVERGPVGALEGAGSGRFGVWLFAVVPQVVPRVLAFTLYRFEVNIRMTAMLGFVGAGGIGDRLHTAINLFQVTDLVALLAVLIAVVTVVDFAGDRLRFWILLARFAARPRAGARPRALTRISGYREAPHDDPSDIRRDPAGVRDRRDVVRLLAKGPE